MAARLYIVPWVVWRSAVCLARERRRREEAIAEREAARSAIASTIASVRSQPAPADSEISPVIGLIGLIRRVGHLHYVGAADMLFALAPRHRGSSSVAGRLPLSLQPPSPLPTAQPPQSPPQ